MFGPDLPERRAVGSAGPFTWNADDTLGSDVAVIYDRAASGGPYASVQQMKLRADALQLGYGAKGIVRSSIEDVVAVRELDRTTFGAYSHPR